MSKHSEKVIEETIAETENGEIEWDKLVTIVADRCGVAETTADTYIRESEKAKREVRDGGQDVLVDPSLDSEITRDANELSEAPVGEGTGKYVGGLEILKDTGHPEIPTEHETGYFRRRMGEKGTELGKKSDVQVVSAVMANDDFSTLLEGKHGVGKDKLIMHICAKTNRPVVRLVANDDPDFIDLLVGSYNPNEDGEWERNKGLLTVALENGYTFIMDEFNSLSGKVQTMLNLILEESGKGQLTIPETNEVITPHSEFNFVATMNPNEIGYEGREELDDATGSRFIPITLPPLEPEAEREVIAMNSGYDPEDPEIMNLMDEHGGVIQGLRNMHDMGKTTTWISTRDVIQVAQLSESIGSMKAACELVLVGRAKPEDEMSIREKINDTNW